MGIIENLNIEDSDMHWHDLAACKGTVPIIIEGKEFSVFDPFFDNYENDSPPFVVRNTIDEMCISCPVQKICYDYAVENLESGLWGGVYLTNGRHDKTRNNHKTKETWKKIKSKVA